MRGSHLLSAAIVLVAFPASPLSAQRTCWRAQPRPACAGWVVTDFTSGVWLNRPSSRFRSDDTRLWFATDVGYMHNMSARDAVGATLGVGLYGRRSPYAGVEWFWPDGAGHLTVRWDRWVSNTLALRLGLGTPITGGRRGGTVAVPGLNVEAGVRVSGRVGFVARLERQRLDHFVWVQPTALGEFFPLSSPGVLRSTTVETSTALYVGGSVHGVWGTLGTLGTGMLFFISLAGYSS